MKEKKVQQLILISLWCIVQISAKVVYCLHLHSVEKKQFQSIFPNFLQQMQGMYGICLTQDKGMSHVAVSLNWIFDMRV